MEVLTTTPFGQRPVTSGLIARARQARAQVSLAAVNKWDMLRDVTTAKTHFGLNASALTVLNALLSFHKGDTLSDAPALVVFPSNRTLASRCHGMPDSTLRRNIATLVKAGLVSRHDSPNGKRYAVRSEGTVTHAFGFDLRPLLVHADRIKETAQAEMRSQAELKRARERAGLLKRDCWKLLEFARQSSLAGEWSSLEQALLTVQKRLRRKLTLIDINSICDALHNCLLQCQNWIESALPKSDPADVETAKMDACDIQNERHIQNSNKDSLDSETTESCKESSPSNSKDEIQKVPMTLVLKACPDIQPYAQEGLRNAHQLVETAHFLHPMLGIDSNVWHHSMKVMGHETASVALACILQRSSEIRNPGGYLRTLVRKAEEGKFSVWPMLRALLAKQSPAVC